jgi:RHS repeat-associated protein
MVRCSEDFAGRAWSEGFGPFSNSYTYDAASNRTGFTAPDGSTNTYSYDTLNRLSTLANSSAGSFGFSYDALSRRTQMTRPNNVTTKYTYDNLSHLLSVLHQLSGSTIDGATYTVDAAGNRTAKTDNRTNVTSNYSYDAIYELTGVTQGSNTTESYSYDAVGNRLSSLGVSPYSYNSSNELTSTSAASYAYDYNGNTTSKTVSGNTTSYTWDYENRLASAVLPSTGGTATFKYDPFGRRIQKVFTQNSTTTTTNYLYDGSNSVEEVDQNGNVLARYSRTTNIDEPLAESRTGTTSYYQQDGLGSATSLSSGAGSLVNTYTYDSFGNLTNSTGSLTNPFRYTAREFDSETSLYYYRARFYDQSIGRFLSEDRLAFKGGINFYRYVRNSPPNLVDPSGNSPWSWGASCAEFFYYAARCADKGEACKLKLQQNAPVAVTPGDPGNGDLLGQLANARNGQGTGFEGCMNVSDCMAKQDECQKMASAAVSCGAFAIKVKGSLFPDLPPSLSQPWREGAMKIRGLLTVLLCNVMGVLLILAAGFLTVRFSAWGNWAADSSRASSAELASKYGDALALLERGVFIHQWVLGPAIALTVGALAALVFRRANLLVSSLSIVSVVFVLSAPTSISRILATCLYILASWLAMILVSSLLRTSAAPIPAAAPLAQKWAAD